MSSSKVSVIVPVYNVEKYFSHCMDSLLNQTLKDIEIILVDDESPDNCPALCDEYAKLYPNVKVIHKKNEGAGFARNSGLTIATGEYVAFVDPDDFVALNAYQRLYSLAAETQADVVYSSCCLFNDQFRWREKSFSKEIRYESKEDIRQRILDTIAKPPKMKNNWYFIGAVWSALYRHSLIKDNRLLFPSERVLICDDLLFNLNFLLHCSCVVSIPDPLYHFRVNPLSITHKVKADKINRCHFFYKHLLAFLDSNDFGINGYLRATRLFLEHTRATISQYVQTSLPVREKMSWLKLTATHPYWREIASSFPYRQLPLRYALHFYLLYKGYYRLLYYYTSLFCSTKRIVTQVKLFVKKLYDNKRITI